MVEEFRFTPGRWPEPFEWAESKKEFLLLYPTFFSPPLPLPPSLSLLRNREGIVCTLYPLLSFRSPFSLPGATLLSLGSLGSLPRSARSTPHGISPPRRPNLRLLLYRGLIDNILTLVEWTVQLWRRSHPHLLHLPLLLLLFLFSFFVLFRFLFLRFFSFFISF